MLIYIYIYEQFFLYTILADFIKQRGVRIYRKLQCTRLDRTSEPDDGPVLRERRFL